MDWNQEHEQGPGTRRQELAYQETETQVANEPYDVPPRNQQSTHEQQLAESEQPPQPWYHGRNAVANPFGDMQELLPLTLNYSTTDLAANGQLHSYMRGIIRTPDYLPYVLRRRWQVQSFVNVQVWMAIDALRAKIAECKRQLQMPPSHSTDMAAIRNPSYVRGTINPPIYLPREQQMSWRAQEEENFQLGAALDALKKELAECKRFFAAQDDAQYIYR